MVSGQAITEMNIKDLIVSLFIVYIIHQTQAEDLVVPTKVGHIKGKSRYVTYDRNTLVIYEFLGIPFAESPTGNLRFAKPVPKELFANTYDATTYGVACPQFSSSFAIHKPDVTGEDCLSLNIYTPDIRSARGPAYPVMIFICGGGYSVGDSKIYSGHVLSAYGEVVIVTINYRVGAFGFLSTENDAAPGNVGLWDQHLAIKWVKDNIGSFRGDNSRITIFGESAGASSVSYQTMYERNTGLFQRAIVQSGSANANWYTFREGDHVNNAKMLAMKFNCSSYEHDNDGILSCLREVKNTTELAIHAENLKWHPRLDEDFITSQALASIKWPSSLDDASVSQKYDMIVGSNGYEGHFMLMSMFPGIAEQIKYGPNEMSRLIFKEFVKGALMSYFPNEDELKAVLEGVMFLYTDAENPNDDEFRMKQVYDFLTDTTFFIPAFKDASSHSYMNNKTSTYQYEFNHVYPYPIGDVDVLKGATHGIDIPYVFGFPDSLKKTVKFTDSQALNEWPTSKQVMDYWTNFAKTGNPNSPRVVARTWNKYNNVDKDYLYFPTRGNPQAKQFLNARRVTFWMDYVPKLILSAHKACPPSTSATSTIKVSTIVYIYTYMLYICVH